MDMLYCELDFAFIIWHRMQNGAAIVVDTGLDKLIFGVPLRTLWGLDPAALIVNHGAYGATPLSVLEEQDRWRRRMEAEPTYFMQRILPVELRNCAEMLAEFVKADPKRLVFVENTTTGINAVLRSLTFTKDDEILLLSHCYGAVRRAAEFVAAGSGAKVVDVNVPFPNPDTGVLLANLAGAINAHTRLVILDHITSPSALTLPIEEMIKVCKAKGARVLVDGAHAPGQVRLDIARLEADWYVGNCHKWLMTPKGCAFVVASTDSPLIHPTTISHGYGKGLLSEFDWVGTRDWTAALCIPTALEFHQALGGDAMINRNHDLAVRARAILCSRLGTTCAATAEWHSGMALVRFPTVVGGGADNVAKIRARLLDNRCDMSVSHIDNVPWIRISVAAYNSEEDFVDLGNRVASLL